MSNPVFAVNLSTYIAHVGTSDFINNVGDNIVAGVMLLVIGVPFALLSLFLSRVLSSAIPRPALLPVGTETGRTILGYLCGFLTVSIILPFIDIYIVHDTDGNTLVLSFTMISMSILLLIWLRFGRIATWFCKDRRFIDAFFLSLTSLLPGIFVMELTFIILIIVTTLDQHIDKIVRAAFS